MNHPYDQKLPKSKKKIQEKPPSQAASQPETSGSSWMEHPDLSGMDPSKLAMLNLLAEQGSKKSPQELLPFLMSAASQNKAKGMKFSPEEMDSIIQVLKLGKSPQEIARIDRLIQMMKLLR